MTKAKPETTAPEDQAQATAGVAAQADQAGTAPLSGPEDLPPADKADAAADDAADPSAEDTTAADLEAAKAAETESAAAEVAGAEAVVFVTEGPKDAAAHALAAQKPAKALSIEKLRAAIAQIEAGNNGLQRDILMAELGKVKGAKIEDKGGTYRIRLHGLEVTNTGGWAMALSNWCSKARRACMNAA